jgi:hypothetical protein
VSERDDYDDRPFHEPWTPEQLVPPAATALRWVGAIEFLAATGLLLAVYLAVAIRFQDPAEDPNELYGTLAIASAVCTTLAAFGATMFLAAKPMRQFRRYRLAIVAAVVAIIQLPYIIFGAFTCPFGIWALVVLCRRDVRRRFARQASAAEPHRSDRTART